jgi:LAS superfamily LD-carboxypeptidase LdcB
MDRSNAMTPEQLTGKTAQHLTTLQVDEKSFLVHPDVRTDFMALKSAANHAGFQLQIASGFRDFQRQLQIWNRKFAGESPILDSRSHPLNIQCLTEQQIITAILKWSALPGASRHHWGTDFDIYDRRSLPPGTVIHLEPWEYFSGHQADFFTWLKQHLHQFGFFFPYDKDREGVSVEPWHISHQRTAALCLRELTPEIITRALADEPILGKQIIQKSIETIYNQFVINIRVC